MEIERELYRWSAPEYHAANAVLHPEGYRRSIWNTRQAQ